MTEYTNRELRREILKILAVVAFSSLPVSSILRSMIPSGFEGLLVEDLIKQIKYLEQKAYLKTHMAKNYITKEETLMAAITAEGMDIREGTKTDPGVENCV